MKGIKKVKKRIKKEENFKLYRRTGEITRKKRMRFIIFSIMIFMIVLTGRILWIQLKMGN